MAKQKKRKAQVNKPGFDMKRLDNPELLLQRMESVMNSPNERTLRDLMPSGDVSDDEMNRGMYEDIRRMIANGLVLERPVDDCGTVANFLVNFITSDMRRNFHAIAEQFLRNEAMINNPAIAEEAAASRENGNLYYHDSKFRNYLSQEDLKKDAGDSYYQKVLNLMVDCMRLGSQYSRNVLLALYKTYYKREYNRLKRYYVINEYDLLTLFDESIREERGRDAQLHATKDSKTVGEVMAENMRRTPGNMCCFPRAEMERFEEYRSIAARGGKVRIRDEALDDSDEEDDGLIDVNALFGGFSDSEADFINPHSRQKPGYKITSEGLKEYTERMDEPSIFPAVSRIAIMCECMGIQMDMTCFSHLIEMTEERKKQSDRFSQAYDGLDELLESQSLRALSWVKAAYPEVTDPEKYQEDIKFLSLQLAQDMIHHVFLRNGIPKNALYGTRYFDLAVEMSRAIFFMDITYPGYKVGYSNLMFLAIVNYLSEVFSDLYKIREKELLGFLRIEKEHFVDQDEKQEAVDVQAGKILKVAAIPVTNTPPANAVKNEKHKANNPASDSDEVEELKRIIEEQRRLLEEKDQLLSFKEQDIIRQRTLYEEAHAKEVEYKENRAEYEASRKELATLREHLFRMTEDDIEPEPDKLEEMKQAIAGKQIMIIGGHVNWQRRLKQMFPKWRFVAASDYLGTETVDGMDYIYFFTDFMSHALYNKFIGILRERELNYYYIHGTNVEKNVRQIYGDVVRVG